MRTVYVGLELASRSCVATVLDSRGNKLETRVIETGEHNLIEYVKGLDARVCLLMEEGEMADWAWRTLRGHVHKAEVCDPVRNAWIARDPGKNDKVDSAKLAELLRTGNYSPVIHLECMDMVHFKLVVKHYEKTTEDLARQKKQIKSLYRTQGIVTKGEEPWGSRSRETCLEQLVPEVRAIMRLELELLDDLAAHKARARKVVAEMSRQFPIVAWLQAMPGCGLISAARFVARIGEPHRFSSKRKVWNYSCLSIVHPETGGKPIGRERLDKRGCGSLKDVSRTVFNGAMRTRSDNLIKRSYRRTLANTGSDIHARLTCQRKILAVMWAMWRDGTAYDDDIDIRA